MNQQITTELLKSLNACQEGIDLVATYEDKNPESVVRRLVADDHWDYANWLLPRLMDYKGYVSYAVYSAELVLPIWEKKYPKDGRPRKAIEAAKRCIDDPSKKNKEAAAAAERATWAAWAKRCIDDPSENNKRATWAERAAWAAAADSRAAAWATWANPAETEKIKSKITEKGLEILKK